MLRVGIVAGEASGDYLAADLIRHLRTLHPDLQVEGVGGPGLQAAGCQILYPMEKLSVMGLVEVAGSYFELVSMRRKLIEHFRGTRPDVFIGVDAPDFNLGLEQALHQSGIRTVHYVSPSVWAWRQYRIHGIKRAVDLMLVLFPFEQSIYEQNGIAVDFVGHPLADRIPPGTDRPAARRRLGIDTGQPLVAIMPGSRRSELERMLPIQLQTAQWCRTQRPELEFLTSVLTGEARSRVVQIHQSVAPDLPLHIFQDRTSDVLEASDAALLTSGTITLEAMLHNLPMLVGYRLNPLTHLIVRAMVRARYAALPNLLANRPLVAEFLQDRCRPELMGPELLRLLQDTSAIDALRAAYADIRRAVQKNAGANAARAILDLVNPT